MIVYFKMRYWETCSEPRGWGRGHFPISYSFPVRPEEKEEEVVI